ncbi:MAG TPA: hypothetical protein VGN60_03330 [Devosia sp.]|nr:hypothetical protein [Devosia sp.]
MTFKTHALLASTMFALLAPAPALLAQDASQDTTAASSAEAQSWQNPDRIAEIEDESERIRAFSVLIGQSVYDEMLSAQAAQNMESDTDTTETSTEGSADAMSAEGDADAMSAEGDADAMSTNGETDATGTDSNAMAADTAAMGAQPMLAVNVIDITQMLTPADVLALELLAEANNEQVAQLQDFLELDEPARTALEAADVLPADVVGLQRTPGAVDLFVIPGWLND